MQNRDPSRSPDTMSDRSKHQDGSKGCALVTGASRGIGKAIAEECARGGRDLVLVALPGEGLDQLSKEIAARHSVKVWHIEIDLAKEGAGKKIFDFCMENEITVDLLVNNAGFGSLGRFDHSDPDLHSTMLSVNMTAPYELMRLFLPGMQKLPQAWILNISSQAAFFPIPFKATYSASKAFLFYISLAVERELRGSNVHIACVCPGGVLSNPEVRNRIARSGYLARRTALEPEEVARIALRGLFKRKRIILPGRLNRLTYRITRIFPMNMNMSFIINKLKKDLGPEKGNKPRAENRNFSGQDPQPD